jgi:hypothetical protein
MLESLLLATKSIGPFILFMLSPILIPLIGIGMIADRLRGKEQQTLRC